MDKQILEKPARGLFFAQKHALRAKILIAKTITSIHPVALSWGACIFFFSEDFSILVRIVYSHDLLNCIYYRHRFFEMLTNFSSSIQHCRAARLNFQRHVILFRREIFTGFHPIHS